MTDYNSQVNMLRDENERLQYLLHFAQNLQSQLDLNRLLHTTMLEIARILKADRCTVFLLDEEKQELWSIVAMGLAADKEIRFPADKGIAGYVAMTGKVLNIPDCYADARFNPEVDKKTGYRTNNMLTTPLNNKNEEIIGVFQVLNKTGGPFTNADIELLEAISKIAATAIENSILYKEQVESFNSFVETLSRTLDTRDYITAGHSQRVTRYALALCKQMEMDEKCCTQLRYAALLHDIGKLGVPEAILFKSGKLTDDEYETVKRHPAVTREILESIHFPRSLKKVPEIASTHHEKVDGSGYPDGRILAEIPLGGRLLAMADVFDALTSKRQYRDREPIEKIWSIIESETDKALDSEVIDIMQEVPVRTIIEIMELGREEKLEVRELNKLAKIEFGEFVALKRKDDGELNSEEKEMIAVFDKYYGV